MKSFRLKQYGIDVQDAIDKILALTIATQETDGLLSAEDKAKLDAIGIHYNTTAYWDAIEGYTPSVGEIIIYSDHGALTGGVPVPGIKIGTGNAYVQDLAFLGADTVEVITAHINDTVAHVTAEKRSFWDNKLNVNDSAEVVDGTLVFNRN